MLSIKKALRVPWIGNWLRCLYLSCWLCYNLFVRIDHNFIILIFLAAWFIFRIRCSCRCRCSCCRLTTLLAFFILLCGIDFSLILSLCRGVLQGLKLLILLEDCDNFFHLITHLSDKRHRLCHCYQMLIKLPFCCIVVNHDEFGDCQSIDVDWSFE